MTDDATPRVGERAAEAANEAAGKVWRDYVTISDSGHVLFDRQGGAAIIERAISAETAALSARLAEAEADRDDWKATAEAAENKALQERAARDDIRELNAESDRLLARQARAEAALRDLLAALATTRPAWDAARDVLGAPVADTAALAQSEEGATC